ncbi:hypothetical protein EIP86_009636 [Pleurotus ostreatoroseus]|nr:hypothetical protein EIP86_009636 [Pleurotus ostreatoroseus]
MSLIIRSAVWFTLAHTFTTFPILLPIHVKFSNPNVPSKSMTRASISSLVDTPNGPSLLWIHLLLLIWVTVSWFATLHWITRGLFRYRAQKIRESAKAAARRSADKKFTESDKAADYHPHPHPNLGFQALSPVASDEDKIVNRGLRTRTIMVTDIPPSLRAEKELREYFEYYLSRPIAKPTVGVTSSAQPGFVDRMLAFVFNRAMRLASRMHKSSSMGDIAGDDVPTSPDLKQDADHPLIQKVVIVRKMTELVSLLERREEVLTYLEAAHIKLARNALQAVASHLNSKSKTGILGEVTGNLSMKFAQRLRTSSDLERGAATTDEGTAEGSVNGEDRMTMIARSLMPFLPVSDTSARTQWYKRFRGGKVVEMQSPTIPSTKSQKSPLLDEDSTIWDALLSLPRSTLDAYQPLIHLSALFRGKTVPAIDYYTAKLNLLTSLITEQRAQPAHSYQPMSTAFVTFADPADARRACKYLAVHPNNPVNVCLVSMAPSYEDLNWKRLMKSTFRVEFVKDWVVNAGVW